MIHLKKALAVFLTLMMLLPIASLSMPTQSLAASDYSYGDFTFSLSGTNATITSYPETATGSVIIPSKFGSYTVTAIGNSAFYACTLITDVVIPNTVKSIGNYAFAYCPSLVSVEIPSSVTSIGTNAFKNSNNIVIACEPGSYAEQYAKDKGIPTEQSSDITIVIGVLKDYVTLVVLNGTDSWISEITVDSKKYAVKKNLIQTMQEADKFKGKEVCIALSNGEVVDILLTNLDTDNDGLYDYWEIYGADFDRDGSVDLALNEMGSNPNKKDVFVEVDWVSGCSTTSQEFFDQVAKEYNAHGINLHIDFGTNSVDYVTEKSWGMYPEGSGANSVPAVANETDTFDRIEAIANLYFTASRRSAFHYCVFTDQLGGAGGTAYLKHQLFTVLSTMSRQAKGAAFMHELGHNLGLRHGGADGYNNKPNYLSNMNYLFAYDFNHLAYKYSDYDLPDIDENRLNERLGIDPSGLTSGTGIETAVMIKGQEYHYLAARTPIDYNLDGDTNDTSVKADISNKSQATQTDSTISYDVLTSQNDWAVLDFKGGNIGGNGANQPSTISLSATELIEIPDEPTIDDLRDVGLFPKEAEGSYDQLDPGTPATPTNPTEGNDSGCPYCGKEHTGLFGWLVQLIHNIMFRILGARK